MSYRLLYPQQDWEQEVFNSAYHFKADPQSVMSWPITFRREMWSRVIKRYDFERKESGS